MSFNISLSGLNASNKQLDTISNNIANVSTSGFKESRTEFASVYNGSQAGGVQVVGISQNFDKSGSITGTGRSLDLALTGGGFFVTEDSKGQVSYTRSGIFNMDANGTIITNTGAALQGYSVDANNNLQQGTVGDIQVSTASLPAKATDNIDFVANLDARSEIIDTATYPFDPSDVNSYTNSYTTPVYDSLGNQHTVSQYFVKTGDNQWDVKTVVNGDAGNVTSASLEFDTDGTLITEPASYTVAYNPPGASPMNIKFNMETSSQYGSDFVVAKNVPNGYTAGEFSNIRVEDNGQVYASYSNGQSLLQGQVVLANFAAPQELVKTSDTSWTQSFASGVPTLGTPGSGQFGALASGAIEGSNVDLTAELVNLMTAQRNYQANTKSISTADKLTQALFNVV